jgi:hypothetical protein
MPEITDAEELRDIRRAERGELFKRFVAGEPIQGFFARELLPLFERHFAAWLDQVMAKQAAPEVLKVISGIVGDMDERINIGERASKRLIERRFKKGQA